MSQFLDITGLVVGFIGAILAFLDSWRTGSQFTSGGVKMGYEKSLKTWFWKNCGSVGFVFITISFLLQFIAKLVH